MENEQFGRVANTGFSFSHESGMEGVVSPRVSVGPTNRHRTRNDKDRHHHQNGDRLTIGDTLRKSLHGMHLMPRGRASSKEPLPLAGNDGVHPHTSIGAGDTARISNSTRERRNSYQKSPVRLPFLHHSNQHQNPHTSEPVLHQNPTQPLHYGSSPLSNMNHSRTTSNHPSASMHDGNDQQQSEKETKSLLQTPQLSHAADDKSTTTAAEATTSNDKSSSPFATPLPPLVPSLNEAIPQTSSSP